MAVEQYHASRMNAEAQPILSTIYSTEAATEYGPNTAKRFAALGAEAEFVVSQAVTPRLFQDSKFPSPPQRRPLNNLLNKVFTHSPPTSPPIETAFVTVLLLPQNGKRPVLITLRTIDIRFEAHKDNHLSHIPDMRSFWGDGEAWHSRMHKYSSLAVVQNSADHALTGTYMLLYTPERSDLPKNKRWQEGVSGDACIVKMGRNMWGKGGVAAYDNVEKEFLESGLYKKMLAGLFDTPLQTMQLSARNVEGEKEG
ncbi:hypothetical protein CJF31_00009814 [Rutstroemia sp. NJR-2017a BVV2]|nr:hypothetical protein CJF31_00009814 [Rutstroemia sp. NJR-2017a BVV2]